MAKASKSRRAATRSQTTHGAKKGAMKPVLTGYQIDWVDITYETGGPSTVFYYFKQTPADGQGAYYFFDSTYHSQDLVIATVLAMNSRRGAVVTPATEGDDDDLKREHTHCGVTNTHIRASEVKI